MAHEKRLHQAKRLAKQVRADVFMLDDNQQKLGCEANHKRTWRALIDHQPDWCVVLEDDAIPVDNFRKQLTHALTAAPTDIVSLYLGRSRPQVWQPNMDTATQTADTTGAHWITTNDLIHAVGAAIRTHLVDDMLHHHLPHRPADANITKWAIQREHTIGYTWPSLIDHADGETLVKHPDGISRPPGRIAWRTGTHDQWNSDTVWMPDPLHRQRRRRSA